VSPYSPDCSSNSSDCNPFAQHGSKITANQTRVPDQSVVNVESDWGMHLNSIPENSSKKGSQDFLNGDQYANFQGTSSTSRASYDQYNNSCKMHMFSPDRREEKGSPAVSGSRDEADDFDPGSLDPSELSEILTSLLSQFEMDMGNSSDTGISGGNPTPNTSLLPAPPNRTNLLASQAGMSQATNSSQIPTSLGPSSPLPALHPQHHYHQPHHHLQQQHQSQLHQSHNYCHNPQQSNLSQSQQVLPPYTNGLYPQSFPTPGHSPPVGRLPGRDQFYPGYHGNITSKEDSLDSLLGVGSFRDPADVTSCSPIPQSNNSNSFSCASLNEGFINHSYGSTELMHSNELQCHPYQGYSADESKTSTQNSYGHLDNDYNWQ
ncbi:hypothetical protein J437_LFUL004071, partial [Ladona fulva]